MMLTVYVPREGSPAAARLAPRSAVVGEPVEGGIDCHYEGAVYDQANLRRFHERLYCAASRRAERYPTTARARFPADSLVPVATYDAARGVVTAVQDGEALARWSGESVEEVVGSRAPEGVADWTAAVTLAAAPGSRPLGRRVGRLMFYRTQAGQVLHLDGMTRTARVLPHDDGSLPGLLEQAGADEVERRYATGAVR